MYSYTESSINKYTPYNFYFKKIFKNLLNERYQYFIISIGRQDVSEKLISFCNLLTWPILVQILSADVETTKNSVFVFCFLFLFVVVFLEIETPFAEKEYSNIKQGILSFFFTYN